MDMVLRDYVKSSLESPVFQKSDRDFRGLSLSQPLNDQRFMQEIMEEKMYVNVTDQDAGFGNTTTDNRIPGNILDQSNSVSFLTVAIPLLIAGIIALFISVLVCVRCKRKRDAAYGEDYEFSLVDQSIQANQSSIIGHAIIMANGTEYHEIGDLMDPSNQTHDNVHGVLSMDDPHSGENGGYVLESENGAHDQQRNESVEYVLESEIGVPSPPLGVIDGSGVDRKAEHPDHESQQVSYTNEYFSLENCVKSPYFVLEKGKDFVYINER